MTLYLCRLQYGFRILASSQEEAYQKACKIIRDNPEAALAGVEIATMFKKRGLLRTFLLG
jgi:hypothetical protein